MERIKENDRTEVVTGVEPVQALKINNAEPSLLSNMSFSMVENPVGVEKLIRVNLEDESGNLVAFSLTSQVAQIFIEHMLRKIKQLKKELGKPN